MSGGKNYHFEVSPTASNSGHILQLSTSVLPYHFLPSNTVLLHHFPSSSDQPQETRTHQRICQVCSSNPLSLKMYGMSSKVSFLLLCCFFQHVTISNSILGQIVNFIRCILLIFAYPFVAQWMRADY
jgi:hypothetical protein